MKEKDILGLVENDPWRMKVLETAKALNLPDWWVGAGFVRSLVWDYLHDKKESTPIPDIDVIYFDKSDFTSEEAGNDSTQKEIYYEKLLSEKFPGPKWSVTNQARMHIFHQRSPYKDSTEALGDWVETATCVAVKIDDNGKLILTAPHGIDDLVNLILRPVSNSEEDLKKFDKRISEKGWLTKWPKLKVVGY